jgi:hypothetical protein
MTITCNRVDATSPSDYLSCKELDSNGQITWNFDSTDYDGGLVPGSYPFIYDVIVGGNVIKQFTVYVVLIDPCLTPTITIPGDSSQVYVITNPDGKYTLEPSFAVSPDFCAYTITTTVDSEDITVEFDPDTQELVVTEITDTLAPSNPNDDDSTEHSYPVETTIVVTDS